MKNPFVKDDRYEKLKVKLESIIREYEKLYGKTIHKEIASWMCADIQDAINEVESETS
jgi:hypothetical protein